LKNRTDYDQYGGAPLLGVNGVCIICHGRSNERAVANAIGEAEKAVKSGVVARIAAAVKGSAE
jgi:glycerol-3-phosphate acyltransferase PlsX